MSRLSKTKVLVVDDHPLVAQATKQLLEQIEEVEVIGIAGNAKQCMDFVLSHQPELVFLDYQLPDQMGSKVAEQIKEKFPHIHVVIFTGINVTDMINQFIDVKVSGILSKESSESVITSLVKCIIEGHTVLPLSLFHQMKMTEQQDAMEQILTSDELTIMELMVKGSTQDQIAEVIHVSKRSVDNYLKRIYKKLGVKSRVQAIQTFVLNEHQLKE
jgi:two-component system competent response regulator ComA